MGMESFDIELSESKHSFAEVSQYLVGLPHVHLVEQERSRNHTTYLFMKTDFMSLSSSSHGKSIQPFIVALQFVILRLRMRWLHHCCSPSALCFDFRLHFSTM